jgi:hypothetical protein
LRWFEPPDPPEPDDPVATVDPLEDVCDVSRLRLSLVATSVSIPGLVQMRPATGPNAPFVAHCSLSVRFDDGQSGGIVAVRLAGDKTPTAWRVDVSGTIDRTARSLIQTFQQTESRYGT